MSLLKRLEHGGAAPIAPVAPQPSDASHPTAPAAPEPMFRPNPIQSQATEAQRSLKDRVKRKLISELDPSVDSNDIAEVRHRLKSLLHRPSRQTPVTHQHRGERWQCRHQLHLTKRQ